MTNEATFEKMQQMKLTGMLHAFRQTTQPNFAQKFSTDELIVYLIDAEYEERYNYNTPQNLDSMLR